MPENKEKPFLRDITRGFEEIFNEHNNPDPETERRRKIEKVRKARIENKKKNLGL